MPQQNDAETVLLDRMLRSVASWLEEQGWSVLVISADKVQGPVDRAFNYELVFRFTGKPPEEKPHAATE